MRSQTGEPRCAVSSGGEGDALAQAEDRAEVVAAVADVADAVKGSVFLNVGVELVAYASAA